MRWEEETLEETEEKKTNGRNNEDLKTEMNEDP
jgi:hypothetical protein